MTETQEGLLQARQIYGWRHQVGLNSDEICRRAQSASIANLYAPEMPWYQTAGIVIAAILGVFTLFKILRELTESYRLTSRMQKASELAGESTGPGAKSVFTAEAETLAAKLAARRIFRYSRRDMLSGLTFLVTFGLFQAPLWIEHGNSRTRFALGVLALIAYQIAMARFLPRVQTIRFQRELFVRLQAPLEPLRTLAIPSARDYMFHTTITPSLILQVAHRAFDAVTTDVDLVTAVNLTIETLEESTYKHKAQKPSMKRRHVRPGALA